MPETTETLADGRLLVSRSGPVARIVFNNPERRNAMTFAMWEGLGDVAEGLAQDGDLRVVVLEGAGDRAFISGADISEFAAVRADAGQAARYEAAVARAEASVAALPQPTVALIRGYCIGGGVGIAVRCDLRIADDAAVFAITPAKLGLGYSADDVAALHRLVGPGMTADMLFTARRVPAPEALARGLCSRVIPAAEFQNEAEAVVQTISQGAPLSLRAVKAALRDLTRPEAARDPATVDSLVAACFDSADYREGQAAFAEKRKPVFVGR